jgi:hypothetical protein
MSDNVAAPAGPPRAGRPWHGSDPGRFLPVVGAWYVLRHRIDRRTA